MDALFEATPSEVEVAEALRMWPELAAVRVRPLLVTAFGDIYVETRAGDVWVASPIQLSCSRVAGSVEELQRLFADSAWADTRLLSDVLLLARDQGIERPQDHVFSIGPHPSFTGTIETSQLVPMTLRLWHHIALQIRGPNDGVRSTESGDIPGQ